jgi:hypothetical protein
VLYVLCFDMKDLDTFRMVNTENNRSSECETLVHSTGNGNNCNSTSSSGQDNCCVVSDSEDDSSTPVPGLTSQQGDMHCKIVTAFTRAFAKQNIHFEKGKGTARVQNGAGMKWETAD